MPGGSRTARRRADHEIEVAFRHRIDAEDLSSRSSPLRLTPAPLRHAVGPGRIPRASAAVSGRLEAGACMMAGWLMRTRVRSPGASC